jgi:hypothetical protein
MRRRARRLAAGTRHHLTITRDGHDARDGSPQVLVTI